MKGRLYLAAALVLAAGLSAGAVLYLTGGEAESEGGTYIVANGVTYYVPAQMQKTYVRDLQRFGGRTAVLFDEFDSWFGSLWRGRALGVTVAVLSSAFAGVLFIAGRYGT